MIPAGQEDIPGFPIAYSYIKKRGNGDGMVLHVTHALPQGQGIDESAVYADYFYMEALMRYLEPDFVRYW